MPDQITQAVAVLKQGGVIAYPTEYCFGLGCDPQDQTAVNRILEIKQRSAEQGLILIAGEIAQIEEYADLDASPMRPTIEQSWPGPHTWLLPARNNIAAWLRGKHQTIAMRLTAHTVSNQICQLFGGAIVSTSANRHRRPALMNSVEVGQVMGSELDYIVDAPVGGATAATAIYDSLTGIQFR